MQWVRPVAVRVLRHVFNKWLRDAEKLHYL
jgi:hypothetical protein